MRIACIVFANVGEQCVSVVSVFVPVLCVSLVFTHFFENNEEFSKTTNSTNPTTIMTFSGLSE